MTPNEYQKLCLRTEPVIHSDTKARLSHGILGVASEAGELLDALKKNIFYGKSMDRTNIKEELGDILWYISILNEACGFTYEELMETNIKKLRTRYPEKFTQYNATNRNLEEERKTLET